MNLYKLFLYGIICFSFFYTSNVNALCTYCYQIASVEITFRNKKVQHGYISWSPSQNANLTEKGYLDEAQKLLRIRFFKDLIKRTSGTEENEVNTYYALARNVVLLRRYDIKRLRIINSNYGSTRTDIQIIKKRKK